MSESAQYRMRVTKSDDVEVTSEGDIVALQLRSLSGPPLTVWCSPKEWVATDYSGHSRSVRRIRRFPAPHFVIAQGPETLATIQCTHLLRTRYEINLVGGATWVFCKLLTFSSVSVTGETATSTAGFLGLPGVDRQQNLPTVNTFRFESGIFKVPQAKRSHSIGEVSSIESTHPLLARSLTRGL